MLVLGIESSCDETGVALYDTEKGLVAHELYSQIALHAEYGGVVPELASRDHIRKLPFLVKELLDKSDLTFKDLNGVCYTEGPGLIGALMVGALYAEGLSYGLNIPLLGVHHMEGHLLAVMLEEHKPEFPFLALLVSGGHTQIVYVKAFGDYEILGETLDDAVGEAFDKTAKLMGLPYPGGAKLSELAKAGDNKAYAFPRPMLDKDNLTFSFSGLKTKVALAIQKAEKSDYPNIAASFQEAVVDTLIGKCKKALQNYPAKALVIAGGVGANQRLREKMKAVFEDKGVQVFYPRQDFCTDNGAMIAYVGHERMVRNEGRLNASVNLKARWPLTELS